ncbi:aminotransferase class III-fold pyridoxal phosphate-dependent enzyme [Actinoplanes sp. NPDC051851]|uniref:aminotransferase family protein n=1 Tax=Actinoplanes sp. NPDC051851 TaxID=3154753 RepID=UPI00343B3FE1
MSFSASPLWHPWSPMDEPGFRPTFVRGEGYRVVDDTGRRYLDASSAALNAHCGHGSTRLADAAADQLRAIAHFDLGVAAHPPARRLAAALADLLPGDGPWWTSLVNSGSEATELAVRIALDHAANHGEERRQIVSLAAGYHGTTLLAKSLTRLPGNEAPAAIGLPVRHIPLPSAARDLRMGDPATLLGGFEAALRAAPTAAVVVEPLLNVGGGVVLPDGFLTGLRALCDRYGALLVLDEVFCGFGRTGRMFGFEHEGITPDIVTYSKGLSSGYIPIGGVSCRPFVHDGYLAPGGAGILRHGHTTGGHAAACRVALEVLDVIREDDLCGNAAHRGGELLAGLEKALGHEHVADVRGRGLVAAVEFADDDTAGRALDAVRDRGVLLRRQGRHLMAVPPLIIDEEGVAEIVAATLEAVAAARA